MAKVVVDVQVQFDKYVAWLFFLNSEKYRDIHYVVYRDFLKNINKWIRDMICAYCITQSSPGVCFHQAFRYCFPPQYQAEVNTSEAQSLENHIFYYHWSTSRTRLRAHSELLVEYCLLSQLISPAATEQQCAQRLITFKWGQRPGETVPLSW